jgi:hypothetical protein
VFVSCVVTATAGLSGCGTSARPPAATPPPVLHPVTPTGPFDGLTAASATLTGRLQAADNQLTSECMRKRSFAYHVATPPAPVDAEATTGVYGLISAPVASAQGYGIADNIQSRQAADAIGATVDAASQQPAYLAALTGTDQHKVTLELAGGSDVSFDSDGCVTIALTELYGPDWNQVSFDLEGLSSQVEQGVEAAPSWKGALTQWASCMDSRYHVKYSDPQAARSDVSSVAAAAIKDVPTPVATQRLKDVRAGEVRLAQQDAACQQSVGLPAVAGAAQDEAQATDMRRYSGELKAYAADFAHAQTVADSLLGTGGGMVAAGS